jgi:poly [ADP-ribose] polymerase
MLGKRNLSQSTCADSPKDSPKKLNAPDVDAKIIGHSGYEVCKSASGDFLSTYLMNSDCGANHNKFYILQLLKFTNSNDNKCWLHTRYGRVGDPGVQGMSFMADLTAGEKGYAKTFKQKTSKAKNYTPIEMKLGASKDSNIKPEITKTEPDVSYPASKLEMPVQNLMNFIFDKKLMEQSVTSVGYDPSKLPLGELSEENVKLGYQHLRDIEAILLKIKDNKTTLAKEKSQLTSLSSSFYT